MSIIHNQEKFRTQTDDHIKAFLENYPQSLSESNQNDNHRQQAADLIKLFSEYYLQSQQLSHFNE